MDCCSTNGLDKMFSGSVARADLKRYLKKGLDKRARLVVEFIAGREIDRATVLEIGMGIGSLHQELLKAGAASTVGVDASSAYVEAATGLAERAGLRDKVEYHIGDFVDWDDGNTDADIMVLDRVVCCYPDMRAIVGASARRSRRLYALTYPHVTWWMRLGRFLLNGGMVVMRRQFRFFLHSPAEIAATLESVGLTPIHQRISGMWHVAVFQRGEVAST